MARSGTRGHRVVTAEIKDLIDIGAVQGAKRKTLILQVRRKEACYKLVVEATPVNRDQAITLYRGVRRDSQETHFARENFGSYPDIIGYVLMRAICRGIEESELIETEKAVLIDLGEMP